MIEVLMLINSLCTVISGNDWYNIVEERKNICIQEYIQCLDPTNHTFTAHSRVLRCTDEITKRKAD